MKFTERARERAHAWVDAVFGKPAPVRAATVRLDLSAQEARILRQYVRAALIEREASMMRRDVGLLDSIIARIDIGLLLLRQPCSSSKSGRHTRNAQGVCIHCGSDVNG